MADRTLLVRRALVSGTSLLALAAPARAQLVLNRLGQLRDNLRNLSAITPFSFADGFTSDGPSRLRAGR